MSSDIPETDFSRANSALDPETTDGLAKPYYEAVVGTLLTKNDPRYNPVLIGCYSYLGYCYLVVENYDEKKSAPCQLLLSRCRPYII